MIYTRSPSSMYMAEETYTIYIKNRQSGYMPVVNMYKLAIKIDLDWPFNGLRYTAGISAAFEYQNK